MKRATLTLVFLALSSAAFGAAALPRRIAPGGKVDWTFELPKAHGAVYLWVRARSESGAGYRLGIAVNDHDLTPENVTVLNKCEVIDAPAGKGTPTRHALFDAARGAWYLVDAAAVKDAPHWLRGAYVSHYHEYLFRLDRHAREGRNGVTFAAADPRSAVLLEARTIAATRQPCILWQRPWMEAVFPWQTPGATDGTAVLDVRACPGEREPVSFSLFALRDLRDVRVELSEFRAAAGTLPAATAAVYTVDALDRTGHLGEAASIARMAFVPEKWREHSPELLVPLRPVSVAKHQSQRFLVDVNVPSRTAPSIYTSTVTVTSGGTAVATLPLRVTVLPIELLHARQHYWIWRLQWSPLWEPDNVACLRDIKAHGFDGLARLCGAGAKIRTGPDGRPVVDGAEYERAAAVLREAGLLLRVADDHLDDAAWAAALAAVGLEPCSNKFYGTKLAGRWSDAAHAPKAARRAAETVAALEAIEQDMGRDAILKRTPIPDTYTDKVLAKRKQIDAYMVDAFRQAGKAAKRAGLDFYVFPVDEPCGTPWRREWVRLITRIAHEAGLRTWNTRNDFSWDAGIDVPCIGGHITEMYREPSVQCGPFTGDLKFPPLPLIGGFRSGAKYHFRGVIDDVYVYNRPLLEAEILAQHERPARKGLIAVYCFDEPGGATARDSSGNGLDAAIRGAARTPGRHGGALRFDGVDDIVETPDCTVSLSEGWSISLWLKGTGCPFGRGYDLYAQGGRVRFWTTSGSHWSIGGPAPEPKFWDHLTVSFDNRAKTWTVFLRDAEKRGWYRENVKWNYMQIRSMPARNARYKMGLMAWQYRGLENITAFCYDWNQTSLYVVYPKDGQRFAPDGTTWYGTLGWLAAREGIDDGRYLHTLEMLLAARLGEGAAREHVQKLLAPVDGPFYQHIRTVDTAFGGYDRLRTRIVDAILVQRR